VKVGFSQNGFATNNYYTIHAHTVWAGLDVAAKQELKVCELYLSGTSTDVDVIAGLTGIECSQIVPTNWTGSAGVG
jgi:hypothetical protein